MKADNSSSYSSSPLLNIMIPQFQQLLTTETPLSGTIFYKKKTTKISTSLLYFFLLTVYVGSWVNSQYTLESTNKRLSPPISVTPSSICTG